MPIRQRTRTIPVTLVVLSLVAAAAGGEDGSRGETARRLVGAARRGAAAEVAALLRTGVSPDAADAGGWTALHESASRSDLATARLLLDAGAAPDLRSRLGGTPLDVAECAGHGELARLLRQRGARGSGKSIGDTVCVRPWQGDGYCGTVEGRDATRVQLRVDRIVGCARGCPAEPACSAGRVVGGSDLGVGERLWVPTSCLTHTGLP